MSLYNYVISHDLNKVTTISLYNYVISHDLNKVTNVSLYNYVISHDLNKVTTISLYNYVISHDLNKVTTMSFERPSAVITIYSVLYLSTLGIAGDLVGYRYMFPTITLQLMSSVKVQ